MSRVWQLLVRADGDTKAAQRELAALQKRTRNFGNGMKNVGRALTMGLTLPLVGLGILGVKGLMDAERASAQTAAALKSTGNTAQTSVKGIQAMSMSLRRMSGVDDEIIQKGANVLLTFTKISNAGGKAGGMFDQATEAALNMSVAMGTDMTAASMLVGKALNDPVKGMSALRRSGVQLTKQQEVQIKKMVEAGDVTGAQTILLKELETQFGGSAKAAGGTFAGQLSRARLAVEEMAEAIMQHALPHITRFAEWITKMAERFGNLSPRMQKFALIVGIVAAAIGPLLIVLGTMITVGAALIPVIAAISLPMLLVAAAIAALIVVGILLYKNWDTIKQKVGAAWDAIKNKAQSVWTWLRNFISKHTLLIVASVTGPIGSMVVLIARHWAAIRSGVASAWALIRDTARSWAGAVVSNITNTIDDVIGKVRGVWNSVRTGLADAWGTIRSSAVSWAGNVRNAIVGALDDLPGKLKALGAAAGAALANALKAAVNAVISRWNGFSIPAVSVAGKQVTPKIDFPDLPLLARGGITRGPSIAGEAGPEAVIPLGGSMQNRRDAARVMGQIGMGGMHVTINGAADPEAVARRVAFILGGSRLRMGGAV